MRTRAAEEWGSWRLAGAVSFGLFPFFIVNFCAAFLARRRAACQSLLCVRIQCLGLYKRLFSNVRDTACLKQVLSGGC